jgi:uncharacterized membrane protein (UPF0127 family)
MRGFLRTAVALAALLLAGACGYGANERAAPEASSPSPEGGVNFGHGTVIIDKGRDTVLLDVEIAQTPEQHRRGLMGRKFLAPDAGMVFVYFDEQTGAFWMKDTLIPLSIAFYDQQGRIERIVDMKPCRRDPCKLYDPGVPFWGALEVNRGAFERWGVGEGDRLSLTQ